MLPALFLFLPQCSAASTMSAPPKRKPAPVARKSSAAIPATSFYVSSAPISSRIPADVPAQTGPTVPKQGKPEADTPVTPLTAENLQQFLRETVSPVVFPHLAFEPNSVSHRMLFPRPHSPSINALRSAVHLDPTDGSTRRFS